MTDRLELRERVFARIGRACVCCGEEEIGFLTLDHADDDGAWHRKTVSDMYAWALSAVEARLVLQTMCFNCNIGRYLNGGICPHAPKQAAMVAEVKRKAAVDEALAEVYRLFPGGKS